MSPLLTVVLVKTVLAVAFLASILNLAGLLTWVERKQSAVIQDRVGANRAWIRFKSPLLAPVNWILHPLNVLGLFHALADALQLAVRFGIPGANLHQLHVHVHHSPGSVPGPSAAEVIGQFQ